VFWAPDCAKDIAAPYVDGGATFCAGDLAATGVTAAAQGVCIAAGVNGAGGLASAAVFSNAGARLGNISVSGVPRRPMANPICRSLDGALRDLLSNTVIVTTFADMTAGAGRPCRPGPYEGRPGFQPTRAIRKIVIEVSASAGFCRG
jgi:hypothetical protein